ncbi:MAG: arginase family protein, partial [Lachnospiraceae bacterium]|nr:arginase family protein [Lachnospiraceae bacterium]
YFIEEPYDLLLIDHHTDMQEASFGGLLSCGSWAREVLENDVHLGTLTLIGPEKFEEGGEEITLTEAGRKLTGCVYRGKGFAGVEFPLYISVDKDAMDKSECITNWDQGDLTTDELTKLLEGLAGGRGVIGADICGGLSETDPGYTDEIRSVNMSSDMKLIKILKEITEDK